MRLNAPPWRSRIQQAVLARASAALRCLALPEGARRLVARLYAHPHPRHGWEVTDLATELRSAPTPSQLRFMRRACAVMDANAFEVSAGVRGLYPLSAMMNNECSPNTTHGFDESHAMVVRAAVDIPEGRELTNSYTPLLWGTPARQRHLQLTKHFLCRCERCTDPQEFGSLLSALRCGRGGCPGAVVSEDPLDASSPWRCGTCGRQLGAAKARATLAALGAVLARVDTGSAEAVAARLHCPALAQLLHPSNQVAVELKSCLVWHYGHSASYTWRELSDDQLSWKEAACGELLALLRQLRAGRTRLTGLLMLELSCTLEEKLRRQQGEADAALHAQMESYLRDAASVFAGDVTAPPELWRCVAAIGRNLPANEWSSCPLEAPPDGQAAVMSNCCT
ncbi:SET domain-containing protein SmydA-8-like [Schistocerca serialis cubense]|uniref:SET domain-containing protein SmydA-8-like n=1 Tax=Schistocerca serialis cubense TaxID=2023355 RepID=UPI00214E7317|nr:SET domain-containing protein SmydA-8-like [Schistocerca serialis cubense]